MYQLRCRELEKQMMVYDHVRVEVSKHTLRYAELLGSLVTAKLEQQKTLKEKIVAKFATKMGRANGTYTNVKAEDIDFIEEAVRSAVAMSKELQEYYRNTIKNELYIQWYAGPATVTDNNGEKQYVFDGGKPHHQRYEKSLELTQEIFRLINNSWECHNDILEMYRKIMEAYEEEKKSLENSPYVILRKWYNTLMEKLCLSRNYKYEYAVNL